MFRSPPVQAFLRQQLMKTAPPQEEHYRHTPISVALNTDPFTGSLGYDLGTRIPAYTHRPFLKPIGNWLSNFGVNAGRSALGGGVLGALAGGGLGLATGRGFGSGAGVGAAIGGGGSALLSLLLTALNPDPTKRAFYAAGDLDSDKSFLENRILNDSSADYRLRGAVIESLSNLDPSRLRQLRNMVQGVAAGSVVYLLARYFLQFGAGTSALLALLGGAVAGSGGGQHNAYGERVDTEYDPFGHRRLVF